MNRLINIFLVFLFLSGNAFCAEEFMPDFEENTLPSFNERYRELGLKDQIKKDGELSAQSEKVTNVAEPTASTDAATKNYVDNAVIAQVAFGDGVSKNADTVYQAGTDGFLLVSITAQTGGRWAEVRTDGSNPPTTAVAQLGAGSSTISIYDATCVPIKEDNYYTVVTTNSPTITINWVPLD